jgi:hypothetical protein
MKITIPTIYVQDCKTITVTKLTAAESIEIKYDGLLTIVATDPNDSMPELEIVETAE